MDGAEEGAMDLTDEQWTIVEPLIPKPKVRAHGRGRPWGDDRERAPVRRIHTIPSSLWRSWHHGRPRPSARNFGFGISGSTIVHCSSVRSIVPPRRHP